MLNSNELKRLKCIQEAIEKELSEAKGYSIAFGEIQWLAYQLEMANTALIRLKEGKGRDNTDKIILDKAKQILIYKYKLSEEKAHSYLREVAMQNRITKFQVAKKLVDAETS